MKYRNLFPFAALAMGLATSAGAQTILSTNNAIIRNSLCVGVDCLAGIPFSDGTIVLKENNTRIKFADTSDSANFARVDWELEANAASNGGAERFSIVECGTSSDDGICTSPEAIFIASAGAGANALFIDDSGDVGFGTATPVTELHAVGGDSPTLRLEQNGSSGFTPQSWDLAGNETNFFIRDVTNGSRLPFRIRPDAPTSAIFIQTSEITINEDGQDYDFRVESDLQQNALYVGGEAGLVGIGTNTPEQLLHIRTDAADTDAFALFDAAGTGSDAAFLLRQNGAAPTTWEFRNQESSGRLSVGIAGGNTPLKIDDLANNNLLKLGTNGNPDVVEVTGRLLVNSTQLNVPDYVFADDYTLRPLADVRSFIDSNSHLPEVPSAAEIARDGVDMTEMQMVLLKKVEELTLYTLAQDDLIASQHAELGSQRAELDALYGLRAAVNSLQQRLDEVENH